MVNISVLFGGLVLVCLGSAPASGSFFHGPPQPQAVGVPVGVPFPVPVPVPSPVPVPVAAPVAVPAPVAVSDTVTIPAAYGYSTEYSSAFHHSPPPVAHFKYAAAYAAPAPSIKYSLGAPVTTTTTTYSGFAAPPPPLQYAAHPVGASHYAAPPPSQFYSRFAPPPGYQLAAAWSPAFPGRYKLHFGAPPPSPAAVYGAAPPPQLSYSATQGW
ncbi:extensin-1 [Drosophila guanche]|uniref:Blast:Extensin-1 n=1 Tax=Drosophila guanche TaxID=7266 RepID=A0A3B0JYC2_DROGU|nr:extensin-1 [Drosophila guanche]SPP87044.1 blast:Extensin-1 [Drosophila guanche]